MELEEDQFLFGHLVVRNKLSTQDQVDECIDIQRRLEDKGSLEKLGDIMVSKGYLTENQLHLILKAQQRISRNTGQRIPGYEIEAKLGQGSMGSVYKAKQISMDRLVAIKVLSQQYSRNKQYVHRFLREARAAAQLGHPNIVRAIDVGNVRDLYFFVMEFVDGFCVQDRLRREAFGAEEAIEIACQLCGALAHAHTHGVIHRDIKPDNILVSQDGQAKLCDLGLAKATLGNSDITDHGTPLGTPYYMSPEQARAKSDLDARTDLYSLGATLYHMVTGAVPFEGNSAPVVMVKLLTEPLIAPIEKNAAVSAELSAVIEKMMAKEMESRHASAEEVYEDLHAIRRNRPPPHTPSAAEATVPATHPLAVRASVTPPPTARGTGKPSTATPRKVRTVAGKRSRRRREPSACLTFLSGQERGRTCEITEPTTTVGRMADCDVQVKDIWFSRKHFVIHESAGAFEVEDLGSMNGTRINGRSVRRAELRFGDELTIYDTNIRFHREEGPE